MKITKKESYEREKKKRGKASGERRVGFDKRHFFNLGMKVKKVKDLGTNRKPVHGVPIHGTAPK